MLPLMLGTNNALNQINNDKNLSAGQREQYQAIATIAATIIVGLGSIIMGSLLLTASITPIPTPLLGMGIGLIALGSLMVVIPIIIAIYKKGNFSELYQAEKLLQDLIDSRASRRGDTYTIVT